MKYLVSFLVLFLLLNSCKKELKPTTFETTTFETAYTAAISITFDRATGQSDLSKTINANIEKAITTSLNSVENNDDLKTLLNTFNSEYIEFKTQFAEASESVWELHVETELAYQSKTVITIAISTYEFKGGAHGNAAITFLNLDAKTGAVLMQNDIIKDLKGFKFLAEKHFIVALTGKEANLDMESVFFGKPFQLPENIGYSDDGLVLLYNTYEVATYNEGYTEFVIPFEELKPYLVTF